MSDFSNAVLTSAGLKLLQKAIKGDARLEFTKVTLGSGVYTTDESAPGNLQEMTALKNPIQSYPIKTKEAVNNNAVRLTVLLTNWDQDTGEALFTEGFKQNEMGLFCKAVGDDTSEVLYSVSVVNGDAGDIMPAFNGTNQTQIKQKFVCTVDNAQEVRVTIKPGYTIDDELNEESVDPVQNKVIAKKINYLEGLINSIITTGKVTVPATTKSGDNLVTKGGDVLVFTKKIGG